MKITEKEFNVETGEETITERDETAAEKKEREAYAALISEKQAEAEAKATQKAALLDRLGITEAEARLLLG
jgi:hypothetical protein